ncbi:MAG: 3-deoxy-8-phosphooctulonate synthase [Deltaproteobacteria bacterium]|nr:3-deoxy-8-phosphooctulonate synthase [Deltaproteobacteria bacterium]
MSRAVSIGRVLVGGPASLALIAGPCVIEGHDVMRRTAEALTAAAEELGLGLIFKSSFDKANRSSAGSYRGPGLQEGLRQLDELKREFGFPVVSDVHETAQIAPAAEVLDCLQIPAFLARQTDLLAAAAESGRPVNVKKGQFMAPEDMALAAAKMEARPGFAGLLLCERGSFFGYHNLVVDMRSLAVMAAAGWPVIFDATHSVQRPSAGDGRSDGDRRHIPTLARAAVAAGLEGLFMETHPCPERAKCDGPNQWPLDRLKPLLSQLKAFHELAKAHRDDFAALEPSPLLASGVGPGAASNRPRDDDA